MMSETGIASRNSASGKASGLVANWRAQFVVDPEKRLVTVQFGNKLTAKDIARYAERLRIHPEFQPEFSEIANLTEVEEIDLQAEDFLKLADKIDPFSPKAKRAFVVQTTTQRHAARMHKLLRSEKNFEIFESLEDAEKWVSS
jgi:hypothetical protein